MQNNAKAKLWSRWIVFFIPAIILLGCIDPEADSQEKLQSAKGYIAKNRPSEATLELKNALQANPENAEARYLLALLNLDFGNIPDAEKEFRRAKQAGWNEEEAQIGLARAAVYGKDFKEMIEGIEIKDSYSPNTQANLYALRALALAGLGLRDQASEALTEGAALDSSAFQVMKAAIQFKLLDGDYKVAREKLTEALRITPDNPELLLLSGVTALRDGDISTCIAANQRVIELEPSNITTIYGRQARLHLARLQIADKQYEQATTTLKPLLKQYANDPESNYLGGMLAFAKGEYSLAEERLLKVIKLEPEHLHSQLLLGTVNFQQENYEQAAHYLSRFISRAPQNLSARKLLGQTYVLLGQGDKAQEVFKHALNRGVDDAELLAWVGLNDLRGGNISSGIENLEKAVEAAPANLALRKELAKAYLRSGEAEQAIEELHAILMQENGQENAQTLLILAQLKAGQPENAINTAFGMYAENPDNPAVATLVGNVFAATGDKAEARNYYNKALKLSPGHPQASVSLARLEELEGNLSQAISIYTRMVESEVKSTIPLLALARLANKQGDRESMYEWLEKAHIQAPEQLPPRLILAEAYIRDMRLKEAELVINEARELAPNNIRVLAQWSRLLILDKRYEEARANLKELVRLAPDPTFARVLLAETYIRLGQLEDATRELTSAIERQPDSISALALLTKIKLQLGQFKQAEEYAARIIAINSGQYIGHELTGDIWSAQKDYTRAQSSYAKVWENSKSTDLAVKLSTTLARAGDPEGGINVLRTWLRDHNEDIRAYQFLGTLLQETGQESEAKQAYEKVLSVQPDNLVALNNLAGIYAKEGDPQSLALAEKAYTLQPDNNSVKDTYGWILVQQGGVEKGRQLIEQALKHLSNVPEVKYHYAVALIKTDEKQNGVDMLETLLGENKAFEGREDAEKLLSQFK